MADDGKTPPLTLDQVKEAVGKIDANAAKTFEALTVLESEAKVATKGPEARNYSSGLNDNVQNTINSAKKALGLQLSEAMIRHGDDANVQAAAAQLFGGKASSDQMAATLEQDIKSAPKSTAVPSTADNAALEKERQAFAKIDPNAGKSFEALVDLEAGAKLAGADVGKYSADLSAALNKVIDDVKFTTGFQVNDAMVRHGSDLGVQNATRQVLGDDLFRKDVTATNDFNANRGNAGQEFLDVINQMKATMQTDIDSGLKSPGAGGAKPQGAGVSTPPK